MQNFSGKGSKPTLYIIVVLCINKPIVFLLTLYLLTFDNIEK